MRIAFSPDNRTLATRDEAGVVKLWDVVTAEELPHALEPHTGRIPRVRFSPDGRTLAVGSAGAKPGDALTIAFWHSADDRRARGATVEIGSIPSR